MGREFEIFFSNRLEFLYQQLKSSLFNPSHPPLMRRLVVVYGPAMETWLMLRMAQDKEISVAMGIEFIYLSQAFDHLLYLTTKESVYLPTFLELSLAIEKEVTDAVHHFKDLSPEEQNDWEPLLQYLKSAISNEFFEDTDYPVRMADLKFHPSYSKKTFHLSPKVEKRLISLSEHLARLFQQYGRYAYEMVLEWESPTYRGWQPRLWRRLFVEKKEWSYLSKALKKGGAPNLPFTLHFFSISFLSASEFHFLNCLSQHIPIHYYLLSPCAMFWSDVRSDRENVYLQSHWQKKFGNFSAKQAAEMEELLRDRNPLLANFGRLGREMVSQIEEAGKITHARYLLPQSAKSLSDDLLSIEDLYLEETSKPLSLLHAIQADLLMMRGPFDLPCISIEENQSIQLHVASSKRREVQILYHNLLGIIAQDPSICPSDVIVMAPQIADYVPYIQSIFGISTSQIDFQVLDLGMQIQNEIVQGFLQLLNLSESRWDISHLLQLFEHPSFQRRHQFTPSDYLTIRKWIEEAGIRWGEDFLHRNELLQRSHCEQGMAEETAVGTWDYGLTRLLLGLTIVSDSSLFTSFETPPCGAVDFAQTELLGKWIRLLHSLRDDLSPLEDHSSMSMENWVNFLVCLLENYFQPDFEESSSIEQYEDLKAQFEILRRSVRFFKEASYPFNSVKARLLSLLHHRGMTYRENHLQAVRFCSLMPLRSIPAKVIALIGMEEGAFPRIDRNSSLNLMLEQENVDYSPLTSDFDRYLFLEALHSARDYFLLSYQGYSKKEGKELQPSLVVEELFSYLDKFYFVQGKRASEACLFKHPFDSFDANYFVKEKRFCSFSSYDFLVAEAYYQSKKVPPHRFLVDFICESTSEIACFEIPTQIQLKDLSFAARNPIKFYLNKGLEIYLQTEEDRKLKIEEDLSISSLDYYQLKRFALKEPIDRVLYRAEKEGKLPFGLFKTLAANRLKQDVEDIQERLLRYSVCPTDIFQIEFCTSCSVPTQLDYDRWLFPALSIGYGDHHKVSIVGKLSHVTPSGLIVLSKGVLADTWKAWPEFLLYCHAVRLCPQRLKPQLIFTHSAQPKKAFFEDPEPYIKQFVKYYTLCLSGFSPLLPDWISTILEGDANGLHEKMRQIFSPSFNFYGHPDLRWVLNKQRLPSVDTLLQEWKFQAEELLKDFVQFWYTKNEAI